MAGPDTIPSVTPPEEQQVVPRHPTDLLPPEGELSTDVVIPDDISELEKYEGTSTAVEIPDDPELSAKIEPIRIVLASLDNNVDQFAREAAHEKLAVRDKDKPFLKRFARSVWHTLSREYQIVKATKEAREEILESGNLRHHHGKSDEKWREAVKRKYGSKYAEHLIREENGETFHKLTSPEQTDPDAKKISEDVKEIMKERARGNIKTKEDLDMVFGRKREEWAAAGISQKYIAEGEFLVANLDAAGEQIDAAVESVMGLKNLDRDAAIEYVLENSVEVVAGEAKVGARTGIEATRSERLAEKLKGKPIFSEGRLSRVGAALTNEVVMSAMMSVAALATKKGAASAASNLVPGLGAAIIVAFRERRAILDDRALMGRRSDADKEVAADNKRQAEIAATLYESRPASELIGEMGALYAEAGDLKITSREDLDKAIQLQAEIQARLTIERRQKDARLIDFSDISSENMEDQRFDLELASAKLEEDLKRLFNDPQEAALLEIEDGETYEDIYSAEKFIKIGQLSGEMEAKDKLLNKLMRKRILIRVGITLATLGLVKEGAEEVAEYGSKAAAAVRRAAGAVADFMTNNDQPDFKLASNETDLGGRAPDDIGGKEDIGGRAPDDIGGQSPVDLGAEGGVRAPDDIGGRAGNVIGGREGVTYGEQVVISDTAKVTLPEGYKAETATNGTTVTVTGPEGQTFSVELAKDGTLPPEAIEAMKGHGLVVNDHTEKVQGEPKVTSQEMSAAEFAEKHKQEMVDIKHTKWYDNNTSKYDLNELGLHNNLQKNGDITISIKGMTSGGSFHGASGVDWHEAANQGQLMVYLSASQGTQSQAFEIPVNPDGTVTIDKDSPAGALFDERGKFIGGYQEVAVKGGTTADGATKIATLATVVGKNSPNITDTVKTPTYIDVHSYTISPDMQPSAAVGEVTDGDIPFVFGVPIYGRSRLGEGTDTTPPPASNALEGELLPPAPAPGGPGAPEQAALPPAPRRALPSSPTPRFALPSSPTPPPTPTSSPSSPNGSPSGAATGGDRTQRQRNQAAPPPSGGRQTNQGQNANTNGAANGPNSGPANPNGAPNQTPDGAPDRSAETEDQRHARWNAERGGSFAADEHEFLNGLREEGLAVPKGFAINFSGISAEAQRIAIKMIYNARDGHPRLPNEKYGAWRARIVTQIKQGVAAGRGVVASASPEMRPLFEQALDALDSTTSMVPAQQPQPQPQSQPAP